MSADVRQAAEYLAALGEPISLSIALCDDYSALLRGEHGAARGKDSRAEKTRQLIFLADGKYLPVQELSASRTSVTYPIITDVIWPSYPHSGTLL